MRKLIVSALAAVLVCACAQAPVDRALCKGKSVEGLQTLIKTEQPDGYAGLTVRKVAFVNATAHPLSIDAIETSRIRLDGSEVWSFQPTSSGDREDWAQPVGKGFFKRNYLGMNNDDYGGGIPMVCIWTREKNLSVGLAEPVLKLVSMPVSRKGNHTEACIREEYKAPRILQPGDTLYSLQQFVLEGPKGDFFEPLRIFTAYMTKEFGFKAPESPEEAFEPVWCAWGYERTFTVDEVIGTLPKVVELGFKWVDVDDGYQQCEGDWETNDRIGPEGMRRMTDAIHEAGLKAKLWWAPMAADPESKLAKEHPEMLLVKEDGTHEDISWWDSWYLSPVNPHTWEYTENLVDMFLVDWNFDGFKLDGQHLNLSEPDYNPASGLSFPEEACERHPEFFRTIYMRAQADKAGAVVQVCPCGCAVNFFLLPWINQSVASDPTSSAQIRMKRKAYAAIAPHLAYYADHVELSDGGLDFPSQVGVGGVIGTKFTWPKANPDATECGGSLLTEEKEALLRKWVPIYSEKMLSTGEYLNLYDYGFDKPEAHVISKDGALYYAFYAPEWNGEPIELRGLDPGRKYKVLEYAADQPRAYAVDGSDPVIRPTFKGNYLIEVTE
ncbi:MAG: alpha-galactosidase [Bacteroidales bacterium]|nr:alpha-galactosidase [Bacteroidales bacterium]